MHVSACTESYDLLVSATMAQIALCALLGGFGRQLLVREKGGKLGCCSAVKVPFLMTPCICVDL
jgi:hypothetical protein